MAKKRYRGIPLIGRLDLLGAKRVKLDERFLVALVRDFSEHGAATLAELREARPAAYLKIAAALLPVDEAELDAIGRAQREGRVKRLLDAVAERAPR